MNSTCSVPHRTDMTCPECREVPGFPDRIIVDYESSDADQITVARRLLMPWARPGDVGVIPALQRLLDDQRSRIRRETALSGEIDDLRAELAAALTEKPKDDELRATDQRDAARAAQERDEFRRLFLRTWRASGLAARLDELQEIAEAARRLEQIEADAEAHQS